jgi:flagellar motility protein MotE (MotC chaperone)
MNKQLMSALLVLVGGIGFLMGMLIYFGEGGRFGKTKHNELAYQVPPQQQQEQSAPPESATAPQQTPIQQELEQLTTKMVQELKQEDRLTLTMVSQLRSFYEMMTQVQGYAKQIETNLDIVEEISKEEFQEDVKLQASLFSGKKADLVAKHLEEFRAGRVGAILAKMKDKEASDVMDIWAKKDDPKISGFYREVMASYLNNKRRDANPELFNKLVTQKEPGE